MERIKLPSVDTDVSRLAYGCAMLGGWSPGPLTAEETARAVRLVHVAVDSGINLFDLADIYGFGKAEEALGEAIRETPSLRDKILIQSKCGQQIYEGWEFGKPIRVDLSRDHIVSAVEGSLRRLRTGYMDFFLLHIPDPLAEPEEIAKAFDELEASGKVRHFGVSNHSGAQIELLRRYVRQPIVFNQLQVGLGNPHLLADGMDITLHVAAGDMDFGQHAGISGAGTLDYCRLHDIKIQAWSPLGGLVLPSQVTPERQHTSDLVEQMAADKGVPRSVILLAWLLAHPARIIALIGTTNPQHLKQNSEADRVHLSRDEWYELFASTMSIHPPKLDLLAANPATH